jgi:plastocyanin
MRLTLLRACLALACLIALVGGGCGDDDTASQGTAVRSQDGQPIEISLDDTLFEPSTIMVKTGEEVTLTLVNDGVVKHNLSIPDLGVNVDVAIGNTESVTFVAPSRPGQHRIVCDEPGHEQAGMVGTLVVEE